MGELLFKFMPKCFEEIKALKYDLSDEEVMKMAKISRASCEYYDNGVYLLLVYFVKAC